MAVDRGLVTRNHAAGKKRNPLLEKAGPAYEGERRWLLPRPPSPTAAGWRGSCGKSKSLYGRTEANSKRGNRLEQGGYDSHDARFLLGTIEELLRLHIRERDAFAREIAAWIAER